MRQHHMDLGAQARPKEVIIHRKSFELSSARGLGGRGLGTGEALATTTVAELRSYVLQDGQHVAVGFQSSLAMILSWPSSPGVCTWTLQLRRQEGHLFDSTCLSEGDFRLVPNHPNVKAVLDANFLCM